MTKALIRWRCSTRWTRRRISTRCRSYWTRRDPGVDEELKTNTTQL
uniref:Uncharacterized protein n=1 Tax=Arundo donax TaxID=35708 RepID=A0A0A9CIE2_ARUDO